MGGVLIYCRSVLWVRGGAVGGGAAKVKKTQCSCVFHLVFFFRPVIFAYFATMQKSVLIKAGKDSTK